MPVLGNHSGSVRRRWQHSDPSVLFPVGLRPFLPPGQHRNAPRFRPTENSSGAAVSIAPAWGLRPEDCTYRLALRPRLAHSYQYDRRTVIPAPADPPLASIDLLPSD